MLVQILAAVCCDSCSAFLYLCQLLFLFRLIHQHFGQKPSFSPADHQRPVSHHDCFAVFNCMHQEVCHLFCVDKHNIHFMFFVNTLFTSRFLPSGDSPKAII